MKMNDSCSMHEESHDFPIKIEMTTITQECKYCSSNYDYEVRKDCCFDCFGKAYMDFVKLKDPTIFNKNKMKWRLIKKFSYYPIIAVLLFLSIYLSMGVYAMYVSIFSFWLSSKMNEIIDWCSSKF